MTSEEFQKEVVSLATATDYAVSFGAGPKLAGVLEQWALFKGGLFLSAGLLMAPDLTPSEFLASITRSGRCV